MDCQVFFIVHLTNRKGWQQKVDSGVVEKDLKCMLDQSLPDMITVVILIGFACQCCPGCYDVAGNQYHVYPKPEVPATNAFVWLLVWMKWLALTCYGRELTPTDCLFPTIGANSVVRIGEPLSRETFQNWINEAVEGAGIPGYFSTHCFRRGGAQYRFMHAPTGQRWTLATVRWWGGWAEHEHVSSRRFRTRAVIKLQTDLHCRTAGPHSHPISPG